MQDTYLNISVDSWEIKSADFFFFFFIIDTRIDKGNDYAHDFIGFELFIVFN